MLIKAGVDISRLERNTRRALTTLEEVWKKYKDEPIITATYDGNHGAGSLHYANRAFDVRLPKTNAASMIDELRRTLGESFDVIAEKDHIHVELDPK